MPPDRCYSLKRSPSLRSCTDGFLQRLAESSEHRIYFGGETIFREGDADTDMFILDHGIASIEIAGKVARDSARPAKRRTESPRRLLAKTAKREAGNIRE